MLLAGMLTLALCGQLLVTGEDFERKDVRQELLQQNNDIRGVLPELELDPVLCAAAQDHADFMAKYRTFIRPGPDGTPTYDNPVYSHSTNGGTAYRLQKHGWRRSAEEILCMRPAGWRSSCWELWRKSPAHWSSVMSKNTHVGYGIATGPDGCTYYVALYGSR